MAMGKYHHHLQVLEAQANLEAHKPAKQTKTQKPKTNSRKMKFTSLLPGPVLVVASCVLLSVQAAPQSSPQPKASTIVRDPDSHIRDTSKIPRSICGLFSNISGTVHKNERQSRVIGGRDAFIEEYPWQISLQKFRIALPLPVPDWAHTCGGAIINEFWVLTAAHCVDGLVNSIFPGQLRAVIGTDRWRYTLLQRDIQMLSINKIVIHPDWNPRKAQNDIAMVRVSKSITFNDRARPICLPPGDEYETKAGSSATIAGYGFTTDGLINFLPNRLQTVRIPIVRMESCTKAYNRTRIPITKKMICAGTTTYGRCTGALKGDSGSALITYDDEGRAVHTGIVSFSLPCRHTGAPDVYTRTASYVRWIESVIVHKFT